MSPKGSRYPPTPINNAREVVGSKFELPASYDWTRLDEYALGCHGVGVDDGEGWCLVVLTEAFPIQRWMSHGFIHHICRYKYYMYIIVGIFIYIFITITCIQGYILHIEADVDSCRLFCGHWMVIQNAAGKLSVRFSHRTFIKSCLAGARFLVTVGCLAMYRSMLYICI